MPATRRLTLVFLDGVGIGPSDSAVNPFFRADLPWLRRALGGPPSLDRPWIVGDQARAFPIDATLGVEGTPQSGTGQTSLLTGRNGAELFGRHFGPWIPVALRPLVAEENVLQRALSLGLETAFGNAYPRGWPGNQSTRRQAGPPLAASAAGLMTRHTESLMAGDAVASEIVNGPWRRHLGPPEVPDVTPHEAGLNLARLASRVRLTLFAHYNTDYAGHRGGMVGSVRALERVDEFLGGLLDGFEGAGTLLVVSDHGNVEDVRGGHTFNPVLGLAAGPGAEELSAGISALTDIPDAVLTWLTD